MFSKDAISKMTFHGRMANVFAGLLIGEAHRCEILCVIRHSYRDS